jgi:rubredoxin
MKISCVDASERFDNTEFNNVIVDGRATSMYSVYACPQCREKIGFEKIHFEHAIRSQHSNLPPGISSDFDIEGVRTSTSNTAHFLDWLCPKCGLASRVYFRVWVGGRHGDAGISLATILEAVT